MIRIRTAIFSLLILFLSPSVLRAQSVGLVLTGGGAKGLYHIGVMEALEENDIPIDYISGTSMGAIIGGLYAVGYTPREIANIFKSEEVKYWITGEVPDRYKFYFKQMRENASMLTVRLNFDGKQAQAKLPSNLIPSDQLDMAFIEFFASGTVACERDFDKLLVPFRCVGADVVNQKEVRFKSGDLGKAIRASMSLPFAYAPVRDDSTVYYDGGLYNNFPWQPLKEEFNPDILIGSKCVDSKVEYGDLSLMEQMFLITMLHTEYELPDPNDILIQRSFPNISAMGFDKVEYLINKGYEDAMSSMDMIKRKIKRRTDPDSLYMRRAEFKKKKPELLFDYYHVEGLNEKQKEYVRKLLKIEGRKEPYKFEELRSEYFKLLTEKEIKAGFPYTVYNEKTGFFRVDMNMKTKPSLKLKVGGNISSTALNQAYVGLEYKTIGRTANSYYLDTYLSAFHTSVDMKSRVDFFIKSPFFVEGGASLNYLNYFKSDFGFLSKEQSISYARHRDHYLSFLAGMPIGRHSVLAAQFNYGQSEYEYNIDELEGKISGTAKGMDKTYFRYKGVELFLERKNLNRIMFPSYGIHQKISAIFVHGDEKLFPAKEHEPLRVANRSWVGLKFKREHYMPKMTKWFSWGYLVEAVVTTKKPFHNSMASSMSAPAFTPTLHSKQVYFREFRSDIYLAGGVMPIFYATPQLYLKCNAFIMFPYRFTDIASDLIDVSNIDQLGYKTSYMFDVSMVYQSVVGPVSLTVSKYDTGSRNWFLTFNFGIALFSKKGTFY